MEKSINMNKSRVRTCYNCKWAHFVPQQNLPGWCEVDYGGDKYYRCYNPDKIKYRKAKKKHIMTDRDGDTYLLLVTQWASPDERASASLTYNYAACKFFEILINRGKDLTLDGILGTGRYRHGYTDVKFDSDRLKDRRKK
jgi:hypothetical protein